MSELILLCESGADFLHDPRLRLINVRCTGSRNLSFNGLKQREIELEVGSARVAWYETQLLIGELNGGSPKLFFSQIYFLVYGSLSRDLRF